MKEVELLVKNGYKDTPIGEIPKNWNLIKLSDLCDRITKGTTPTKLGFNYLEEGINFVKVESITESGSFISNMFGHIGSDCNEAMTRSKLKVNDLLFSIAGALGRVAIVHQEFLPANTNQALAIIRLKNFDYLKFIFHYLKGTSISSHIRKINVSTAQANLSLNDLNNFYIPLPPIPE